jgi:hypothetical protein
MRAMLRLAATEEVLGNPMRVRKVIDVRQQLCGKRSPREGNSADRDATKPHTVICALASQNTDPDDPAPASTRAIFSAESTASDPELAKKTWSMSPATGFGGQRE